MAVTKLVERCFISDLALVSSPEVACGFRYDPNHCEKLRSDEKSAQESLNPSAEIDAWFHQLNCGLLPLLNC